MRYGQREQFDMQAHGLGEGHSGDEFGPTALADLGGTDWASPDRGAGLEARIERFAVLGAPVNLECLLGYTPAAALRSARRWKQAVNDAFKRETLGAVPLRIGGGVKYLTGLEVNVYGGGSSYRVYTKGLRPKGRFWPGILVTPGSVILVHADPCPAKPGDKRSVNCGPNRTPYSVNWRGFFISLRLCG